MRFIIMIKADKDSEAGVMPSRELIVAMGEFNEQMAEAGVLLAAEGLHPSSKGARVHFSGGKRTVTDGPFPETKELIAGFWIIEVDSLQEAIDWVLRVPEPMNEGAEAEIEIRQIGDISDFPPELLLPEDAAREEALRERPERRAAPGGR